MIHPSTYAHATSHVQVMLALLSAHLLNFTSDKARIMLAVYTTPIVARMCGLPVEHLHIVHNGACTFTMFAIAVYVLLRGPNCIKWMKCSVMNVSAGYVCTYELDF
jgi:hypothetical protein